MQVYVVAFYCSFSFYFSDDFLYILDMSLLLVVDIKNIFFNYIKHF